MMSNDRFIAVALDDGLIVARRDGGRLFVLNGSARFIWEKRAAGVPDAEIPQLTAIHYDIDVEQAQHDFGKTLRQLQAEGLVEPSGNCRRYAIGDASFTVHYADTVLESTIAPLLGHLEGKRDGNGQLLFEFELIAEDAEFVLRADSVELLRSADIDAIIDKLTLAILTRACNNSKVLVSIHAAAVGTDKRCLLLPAPSRSGKSTLTAALLASGRLSYLGDDISIIERGSLRAVPVPGTLVLKSGSWETLLPLLPQLRDLPIRRRGEENVRYWSPPATQVATSPLPVRAIVFACYDATGDSRLKRLPPLEGLSRLIAAPCAVHAPITSEMVHHIADCASTIPFYALSYSSLADARQSLEGLLEP
jgi:hypothetical protein